MSQRVFRDCRPYILLAGRCRTSTRAYAAQALIGKVSARIVRPGLANESVELTWPNKEKTAAATSPPTHVSSILSRHLRDFCACPRCRHPDTNQRLLDSFSLPEDLHAVSVTPGEQGLQVRWSDELAAGGLHESVYTWDWLKAKTAAPASQSGNSSSSDEQNHAKSTYWTSSIAYDPPTVSYEAVMASGGDKGEEGLRRWVANIRTYGFSYVDGCPVEPDATARLLERIAFVRTTHYGGFWDFTANLASKDTAYTTLALGAHTDTTYFSDPAGLQMFHLLEHSSSPSPSSSSPSSSSSSVVSDEALGGQSLLVDGFRAAQVLYDEDPEAALTLGRVGITAHATGNEDAKIITPRSFPVLEFRKAAASGRLDMMQVRWNNDDRGSFATTDEQDIMAWYRAARKWKSILERPESQYWAQLESGRPLIFDNWRVLHGRSAFTGKRRLCGGYVNMDDFLSRWRMLGLSKNDLINTI